MDNKIGLAFFRSYLLNENKGKQSRKREDQESVIQRGKRLRILKEDEKVCSEKGAQG